MFTGTSLNENLEPIIREFSSNPTRMAMTRQWYRRIAIARAAAACTTYAALL